MVNCSDNGFEDISYKLIVLILNSQYLAKGLPTPHHHRACAAADRELSTTKQNYRGTPVQRSLNHLKPTCGGPRSLTTGPCRNKSNTECWWHSRLQWYGDGWRLGVAARFSGEGPIHFRNGHRPEGYPQTGPVGQNIR